MRPKKKYKWWPLRIGGITLLLFAIAWLACWPLAIWADWRWALTGTCFLPVMAVIYAGLAKYVEKFPEGDRDGHAQ